MEIYNIYKRCSNSNAAVAYMDGVSVDTGTISSNQTQTVGSIGALDRGSEWTNGQITLFRMYKGIFLLQHKYYKILMHRKIGLDYNMKIFISDIYI